MYNTTLHTATRYRFFDLVYGQQTYIPTALTNPPNPTFDYNDYTQELKEKLRATNQFAKKILKKKK